MLGLVTLSLTKWLAQWLRHLRDDVKQSTAPVISPSQGGVASELNSTQPELNTRQHSNLFIIFYFFDSLT